jgi:hypothetical protein
MITAYQQRLVAFIDILGFRQLVKDSNSDDSKILLLQDILKYLKTWEGSEKWGVKLIEIEEDAQKKGLEIFKIAGNTACTCFSDSIVVSVLSDDTNINETTSTLIANLSLIGSTLLKAGILWLGGITFGNLIHSNDGIIIGQALIDAYELQSQYAKYPRIILSDVLLNKLNYPLATKMNRYPYHQYLDRFADGCVGFHQMVFYQVLQSAPSYNSRLKDELAVIRKNIINGLDFSFENIEVFLKYKWLAEQYNKLIIFDDGNKNIIYDVNEVDNSHNIHYSNIDSIRNKDK